MKAALLSRLVDPLSLRPLRVESEESVGDDIIRGRLCADGGTRYPLVRGIPRFVTATDPGQVQTGQTFGFKWKKRSAYDSAAFRENNTQWCLEKYGFDSLEAWAGFFDARQSVLDVGCGSGFSSSLWLNTPYWHGTATWIGIDISEAIDVALERLRHLPNTHFVQADALHLPFPDGSFDTIFSEGVLHHTPSTRAALLSSVRVLAEGGTFHFYVYRQKGPVREFVDDYVRAQISSLSDDEAWDVMHSLTHLGQVLSEARVQVDLEEDVPLFAIKAGRYDVQRLIYWHFAKLYWNPSFSFEENVCVNFDWYRPKYAHRQTADEVRQWCKEASLSVEWFHEEEAGLTVRAVKR